MTIVDDTPRVSEVSERAARYLDILAAAEQAHVCGHTDELRALLEQLDPYEVKQLAAELRQDGQQLTL